MVSAMIPKDYEAKELEKQRRFERNLTREEKNRICYDDLIRFYEEEWGSTPSAAREQFFPESEGTQLKGMFEGGNNDGGKKVGKRKTWASKETNPFVLDFSRLSLD